MQAAGPQLVTERRSLILSLSLSLSPTLTTLTHTHILFDQVMELVTRLDSRWETKAMLMDHFVDGFLFKLFLAKWDKICWREHAAQLALECIQALSLVNISFNKPDFQSVPIWSSALQICACVLLIEEELREITLWFLDRAGAESSKWAALKLLYKERLACGLRPKV